MDKIKVIIADDQEVLRKVLRISLSNCEEIEVLGEASDGLELLSLCKKTLPDVIVVDIEMPNLNGLGASRILKKQYSDIKILVLTTFDSDEYIQQFLEVGIDGYLLKGCEDSLLIQAVKSVYCGANTLDHTVLTRITEVLSNKNINESVGKTLTDVEQKVAGLVVRGCYNKDIASRLGISYGRTRNIVSSIYKKTGAKSRKEIGLTFNQ